MKNDFTPLGDLSLLITKGTTPTTEDGGFSMRGVNYIKSESLSYDGSIDSSKFAFVTTETHLRLKRSIINEGDILYSIAGANLGKCGIAQARYLPANTNQAVAIIRIDPRRASNRFISYVLRDSKFVQTVLGSVAQSAQPNVNLGEISRFPIPAIPLKSQENIASVLGALDDKIDLNRQMNAALEAMASAIFRDWFVEFGPTRAKKEGHASYLAANIWSLFPDTLDEGGNPMGWLNGTLGDIARQVGVTVSPETLDQATPYIGLEHMPRRSIALTDWEGAGKVTSGKLAFRKGDFLFGKLRPYFHKVGIAPVAGICSTDIVVLNAREQEAAAFVLACISQDEFVAFTDRTSDGTKMPRTSWDRMERYSLCFPSGPILEAFSRVVEPMVDGIISNVHESRTLAEMRDLLLPKLMSGELRVKDVEKFVGEAI